VRILGADFVKYLKTLNLVFECKQFYSRPEKILYVSSSIPFCSEETGGIKRPRHIYLRCCRIVKMENRPKISLWKQLRLAAQLQMYADWQRRTAGEPRDVLGCSDVY